MTGAQTFFTAVGSVAAAFTVGRWLIPGALRWLRARREYRANVADALIELREFTAEFFRYVAESENRLSALESFAGIRRPAHRNANRDREKVDPRWPK